MAPEHMCGHMNTHWWDGERKGDTCRCGQVPREVFFADACTCRAGWFSANPVHSRDCPYASWAVMRNEWIRTHPEVSPPLALVRVQVDDA